MILILLGGYFGYLFVYYVELFEQCGFVKVVGCVMFSFDVLLYFVMKCSMSDKLIVDVFCEDLLCVFNIKVVVFVVQVCVLCLVVDQYLVEQFVVCVYVEFCECVFYV